MANATEDTNQEVKLVKTYCKPADVNVEDLEFIRQQVHLCFIGKRSKGRFQKLLISTGKITKAELKQEIQDQSCSKTLDAIDAVAEQAQADILARDVHFEPVRQFQLRENGKLRDICEESPKQQVFEYIAKGALDPLFRAKLLPIQYGSLPGKGQIKGKRQNERILRRALHHKTDAAKCDVRKAYPSTTVECVMTLLRRDIGKNKVLLWLVEAIMANYPDGVLLIGGYLPCWLFNYVMSYVLRYILSHRKVRRDKSLKMVLAITCYADDITVYGRISNLEKVMRDTTRWAKETLGLTIKSAWQIVHFASFVQERQQRNRRRKGSRQRTPGLDMMGYVVRRTYTIIRGRNFVRLRRAILRAQRNLDTLGYVPWWRAQRILSQWGEIKHSDSRGFCTKYNVYKLDKSSQALRLLAGQATAQAEIGGSIMAEQYTERPTEIEVFPLGSETDVILRKSIAESETTGENGDVATCWQCEERQIRVPGTVSTEDIAADFEAWWEYTPGTKAQSVEDVRTETVAQMSATCNAAIVGGVDVTLTGGETKHFSLTLEDQLNLLSLQGRVASGADSVPYHADGEECSYYSAADFGRIADAATRWKLYQESYFNALRGYILALETVTELRGVTYGMDIPEAYRTDVLRALLAQQETADVAAE